MNNKETLQSHNSRLNTNNVNLSSILETINNLPSAGRGTTVVSFIGNYSNPTYAAASYNCLETISVSKQYKIIIIGEDTIVESDSFKFSEQSTDMFVANPTAVGYVMLCYYQLITNTTGMPGIENLPLGTLILQVQGISFEPVLAYMIEVE